MRMTTAPAMLHVGPAQIENNAGVLLSNAYKSQVEAAGMAGMPIDTLSLNFGFYLSALRMRFRFRPRVPRIRSRCPVQRIACPYRHSSGGVCEFRQFPGGTSGASHIASERPIHIVGIRNW